MTATNTNITTTLKGRVGGAGTYTIRIIDVTHEDDFPDNAVPSRQSVLTFTIYVVPSADRTTVMTRNPDNAVQFGNDLAAERIDELFGPATEDLPIIFEVEGSGRLYVREDSVNNTDYAATADLYASPASEGRAEKRLETSSSAPVYLDMGGGSSKITAWFRGQNPTNNSKSLTYIYDYAVLAKTQGDPQVGATGGRLEEPLVIKVTDAKNVPFPG